MPTAAFPHRKLSKHSARSRYEEARHRICLRKPDPDNPRNVIREKSVRELPEEHSEWPMMLITQVRMIDHFNRFMKNSPTRMETDYGYEFVDFVESDDPNAEYPLTVTLRRSAGAHIGEELQVRTKYVVGADGARSNVRRSLGYKLHGDQANHAWGVMDIFADTDFPDVRKKCTVKSAWAAISC